MIFYCLNSLGRIPLVLSAFPYSAVFFTFLSLNVGFTFH